MLGVPQEGLLDDRPFTSGDTELPEVVAERVARATRRLLAVERAAARLLEGLQRGFPAGQLTQEEPVADPNGQLVEVAVVDPEAMLDRLGMPVSPYHRMAQQERPNPVPGPCQIPHRHMAGLAQIPRPLLCRRGYPDRGQLRGPVQTGQPLSVTTIGLDLVPRGSGDQRRGHHVTAHPQTLQKPLQDVSPSAATPNTPTGGPGNPAEPPAGACSV
jgi:hypothetical protein